MQKPRIRILNQPGWLLGGSSVIVFCCLLLSLTNPTTDDYKDYAGRKLVVILTQELCNQKGFSLSLNLVIDNCSNLISAQQIPLSQFAGRYSKRLNLGLFSIFSTKFGGKDLSPMIDLAYVDVKTFAIAGKFISVNRVSYKGVE